jgi:hypothetical protein
LQHDKDSDLKRQAELQQARATLVSLAQAEVQITTFCQNANYNLENCSSENNKLAFDMLDIKILASSDHLEIKGVMPQEFVTIEQTSGCMLIQTYSCDLITGRTDHSTGILPKTQVKW